MLSSMTGFGRSVFKAPFGTLTVEIQSVNRKYLEIFVSMPKEFSRFEIEVRKWVSDTISRGQVSVRIFLIPNLDALQNLLPDPKIVKALKKKWEQLAREAGTDPKEIDLAFILPYLPQQQGLAKNEDLPFLRTCVEGALKELAAMKTTEGKALVQDLAKRLKELERNLEKIRAYAPDATVKMKQKLIEKLGEAQGDERLLREVALFAERVDITEEIVRLQSHIVQFKDLLKQSAAGRKMDFLIQEMGREINTIGSKSMEAKISHLVVEVKSELEKMREQVQNLE